MVSTNNWGQSPIGGSYTRASGSFIFNLSNKQKYDLIDQANKSAIYKHNSYGLTFGGGINLTLSDSAKK